MLPEKTGDVFEKDIYPDYLKIFKDANVDIDSLPVIELGQRVGWTEYIDFIDYKEMTAPIMKFRDCYKRPGIVLLLTNKVDMELPRREVVAKPGEYKNTLALFQRYTDVPKKWSFGNGHSDCMFEHNYFNLTGDSFERSPGVVDYSMLERILNGTDPVIGLANVV